MQLSEALARNHITCLTEFTCLADVLEPELIQSCLDSQGVATLRRRKLPMDAMIWAVIGMALFRGESVRSLINKLDIVLPQEIDYVTRSAVTQVRKRLAVRWFERYLAAAPIPGTPELNTLIGAVLTCMASTVSCGGHPIVSKIKPPLRAPQTLQAKRLIRKFAWFA